MLSNLQPRRGRPGDAHLGIEASLVASRSLKTEGLSTYALLTRLGFNHLVLHIVRRYLLLTFQQNIRVLLPEARERSAIAAFSLLLCDPLHLIYRLILFFMEEIGGIGGRYREFALRTQRRGKKIHYFPLWRIHPWQQVLLVFQRLQPCLVCCLNLRLSP